jgi:hypothetical protein
MINDDELLLYYYRDGLDAPDRARIGAALAEQPELAQRLHRLVARLDAAAALPEVPVPAQTLQRWQAALDAAANEKRATPERRRFPLPPRWQLAAAAVVVAALTAVFLQMRQTAPAPIANIPVTGPTPVAAGEGEATAYEHGLRFHLASTERRLANLGNASPEERAKLIDAIIGQNRIYALAAERAGEPQLARVLRAFTPILQDVANGHSQSTDGDLAQLSFELRIMQARLAAEAQPSKTL